MFFIRNWVAREKACANGFNPCQTSMFLFITASAKAILFHPRVHQVLTYYMLHNLHNQSHQQFQHWAKSFQTSNGNWWFRIRFMRMSWNGNIFRITGPFVMRNHRSPVDFPHQGQWCLNKRLTKQSRRRWFETPLRPLWRHNNISPISRR